MGVVRSGKVADFVYNLGGNHGVLYRKAIEIYRGINTGNFNVQYEIPILLHPLGFRAPAIALGNVRNKH